ncbi:hypothetical protein G6F64_015316 [Rhizopus arrhizus]|uniref:Uncharacterized protein n=1 Tax=Rhizopus oryzae TaxID=64495 RepID=A0A9P7BIN1_RHIOR|nr:hypothetical protein G6F64_015316 [Rhizopus arrhizus]
MARGAVGRVRSVRGSRRNAGPFRRAWTEAGAHGGQRVAAGPGVLHLRPAAGRPAGRAPAGPRVPGGAGLRLPDEPEPAIPGARESVG